VEHTGFTPPQTQVQDTGNSVELNTGEVRVRVEKATARMLFLNAAGNTIVQEQPGNGAMWKGDAFRISWSMP
jgi:hypothetical protein